MGSILPEIPQPSVTEISLKIIYLKFRSNFPGAIELRNIAEHGSHIAYGQLHIHSLLLSFFTPVRLSHVNHESGVNHFTDTICILRQHAC